MEVMDNSSNDVCPTSDMFCKMPHKTSGELTVAAILRLIMACLSTLGSCSIILSALYRKTVCNPRVHPIFVLSIADLMLSMLWISGSVMWLTGGLKDHGSHNSSRVGCFTINLMTVILQCVAMNLTLIYALLAYSSIKQRDFSGVYMIQQRPLSVHVWPPLCSFVAYFIAWILPVFLIMIPFGVIAKKYGIVHNANNCSCWCLPFYGNVIPGAPVNDPKVIKVYLNPLHTFITSYACVLCLNFLTVFVCMVVIYYKVFLRIRRMRLTQEQNENTPLYGATQAMILEGQKDAKKRVFLFLSIYVATGIMILAFGVYAIVIQIRIVPKNHHHDIDNTIHRIYIFLLLEAICVPIQGFLNAVAYGWTRGDFLNVMSGHTRFNRLRRGSYALSYDALEDKEDTAVEDDGEEWGNDGVHRTGNSILFPGQHEAEGMEGAARGRQDVGNAMTPGSPGYFLGD